MTRFLIAFLAIYGMMHVFLFQKAYVAFPEMRRPVPMAGFIAFLIFMIMAAILTRALDHAGYFWPARICAFIGYVWMAMIFWFLFLGIGLDLYNMMLKLASYAVPSAAKWQIPLRNGLYCIWAIIAIASVYAIFEANNVHLKTVRIQSSKITTPLRLVQISDLHLSLIIRHGMLMRVMDLVRKAKPDVLVSTGDLLDASFFHLEREAAAIAALDAPMGKYAIFGNHEFYAGVGNSTAMCKAAGFQTLREQHVLIGKEFLLAGVDDPAGLYFGDKLTDEGEALGNGSSEKTRRFVILLKHRPEVDPKRISDFDLQISGHSHGGQIIPFNLLVNARFPIRPGFHEIAPDGHVAQASSPHPSEVVVQASSSHPSDTVTQASSLRPNAHIYVSRGTGFWGPPMRLCSPPEVTLFLLEPMKP